eukprot:5543758-Pyramimonas_sp.AAC.1
MPAHSSHASWPRRELHRGPEWPRSHERSTPISTRPSHSRCRGGSQVAHPIALSSLIKHS